jgi:hypothetical protein
MKTNILFVSLVLLSGTALAQDVKVQQEASSKVQVKATPVEKPVTASSTTSSSTAASASTGGSNIGGKVAAGTNAQTAASNQPATQQATGNGSVQVQTTVSPAPVVTTVQKVKKVSTATVHKATNTVIETGGAARSAIRPVSVNTSLHSTLKAGIRPGIQ